MPFNVSDRFSVGVLHQCYMTPRLDPSVSARRPPPRSPTSAGRLSLNQSNPGTGSAPTAYRRRMHIDPHKRAAAARILLDAATAMGDAPDEDTERRALLALEPLGIDLDADESVAAALAAASDLLMVFLIREARVAGVPVEEIVSNTRQHVLPLIYPDVLG